MSLRACYGFALFAFVYWVFNKRFGLYIATSFTAGHTLNAFEKLCACIYRPWILDTRIIPAGDAIATATGYSFPSGHTTVAVACWGAIGLWYKNNKKALLLSVIFCLAIAFSRNYLGVHTLQDVIVGFIGSYIILICIKKLLLWCEHGKNRDIIFVLFVTFISLLVALYTYYKSYPENYDSLGKLLIDTQKYHWEAFPKLGLIIGSYFGWLIENRYIKYDSHRGTISAKITRTAIGLALLIGILHYTPALWKNYCGINMGSFGFMAFVGFFITLIYPWFIKRTQKSTIRLKTDSALKP